MSKTKTKPVERAPTIDEIMDALVNELCDGFSASSWDMVLDNPLTAKILLSGVDAPPDGRTADEIAEAVLGRKLTEDEKHRIVLRERMMSKLDKDILENRLPKLLRFLKRTNSAPFPTEILTLTLAWIHSTTKLDVTLDVSLEHDLEILEYWFATAREGRKADKRDVVRCPSPTQDFEIEGALFAQKMNALIRYLQKRYSSSKACDLMLAAIAWIHATERDVTMETFLAKSKEALAAHFGAWRQVEREASAALPEGEVHDEESHGGRAVEEANDPCGRRNRPLPRLWQRLPRATTATPTSAISALTLCGDCGSRSCDRR